MRQLTAATLLVLWPAAALAIDPGEAVFRRGGTGEAIVAGGSVRLPASRFPCANCHGADGRGRHEGATRFPPITWSAISAPAEGRPAYDEAAFARAVTAGESAAGTPLSSIMPRYALASGELPALVAFLKRLDSAARQGVLPRLVRLRRPDLPNCAEGMAAAFERFNAEGGAFGRAVQLVDTDETLAGADELIARVRAAYAPAERAALLARARADGHTALALTAPGPELEFALARAGLGHDPSSDAFLATGPVAAPPPEGATLYAPYWAVEDLLAMHGDWRGTLVLAGPGNNALRETLSLGKGTDYLVGYATGLAVADALLVAGRGLTRARLEERLDEVIGEEDVEIWVLR